MLVISAVDDPLALHENALALAAPLCPVLHGIEVDITADGDLPTRETHLIAEEVRHALGGFGDRRVAVIDLLISIDARL